MKTNDYWKSGHGVKKSVHKYRSKWITKFRGALAHKSAHLITLVLAKTILDAVES